MPTIIGTLTVTLFPKIGKNQMSAFFSGYTPVEHITGIGDEAGFATQRSTLGVRRGSSMMMLSLASPDEKKNRSVLIAFAKHIVARVK